jgi:hypothetical protein
LLPQWLQGLSVPKSCCVYDFTSRGLETGKASVIKKGTAQNHSILCTRSSTPQLYAPLNCSTVPLPKSCIYIGTYFSASLTQPSSYVLHTSTCTLPDSKPNHTFSRTHRTLDMLQTGSSCYSLACLLLLLATHCCSNTHAFILSYPSSSTTAVLRTRTTTSTVIATRMSASSSPPSSNVEGMQQVLFVEVRMRHRRGRFIS